LNFKNVKSNTADRFPHIISQMDKDLRGNDLNINFIEVGRTALNFEKISKVKLIQFSSPGHTGFTLFLNIGSYFLDF
tara:strand:- start:182 stop:412 length:231 start_codon:yes stop_codon:yes gene_type:complete